jgi:hypothetical protein
MTVTYGQSYTLPVPMLNDGYVFSSWYNGDMPVSAIGSDEYPVSSIGQTYFVKKSGAA